MLFILLNKHLLTLVSINTCMHIGYNVLATVENDFNSAKEDIAFQ